MELLKRLEFVQLCANGCKIQVESSTGQGKLLFSGLEPVLTDLEELLLLLHPQRLNTNKDAPYLLK